MDAISMLKDDHTAVEQLFRRFERAGDRALVEKRSIVDRLIEELSVHAAIEEQLFYPAVRATVPDTDDLGVESLEEHHVVKWLLSELDGMSPEDERFDAKVTVLVHNVRHHVEVEEGELFPLVRDELGRKALSDLGEAMAVARKIAPTHPHPRAPDTPPGNLVVGTAAGVADRIADMLNGLAQGGVTAIGDIIATVLRREKPRVSPRGAKVARSTATQVRSSASDATEAAIEATRRAKDAGDRAARRARATGSSARAGTERTVRAAQRGSVSTARTAKAGAKGTVTSARKSAKRTATTGKRGATATGRTARRAAASTAKSARRAARDTASTAAGSSN
jgi:hemerythrin-like domain-containing protein